MVKNSAGFDPESDDVFARIAKTYDFLCDVFSLGAHRLWKRAMVKTIVANPSYTVLDMASGTGDISVRLAKLYEKNNITTKVLASDICQPMLDIAQAKAETTPSKLPNLSFQILDAHNLQEIPDASVDAYAVSFAMKICDREKLIPEALRVLKPGGHFYCLEASHIPVKWIHAVYLKYMEWCVPVIARIATGGDKSAHDYLLKGIHDMPAQKPFARELEDFGFVSVQYKNLSLGIVALHMAKRPD